MEPLALRKYFAPIPDADWERLMPDSLEWQPLEGFTLQPYYRRADRSYRRAFKRAGWHLRLNGRATQIEELLARGATAIGIEKAAELDVAQLSALLRRLRYARIPACFECGGKAQEVMKRIHSAALVAGIPPSELRGAAALEATESPEHQAALLQAAGTTQYRTIRVDLMPWHQAGATCVQELAVALSLLVRCLRMSDTDAVARRLYFSVPVGTRYLMHIARLRAMRHLTAQVYEAFGLPEMSVRVEGVPSPRHNTACDPDTHLVRITLQCVAAAVGGCDIITPEGLVAGKIPLILQHEARLARTADPAAGAWYIEALSAKLARSAWALFQQMEAMGGYDQAEAWLRQKVARSAQQRTDQVHTGQQPFIGVNCYPDLSRTIPAQTKHDGQLAEPFENLRRRVQQQKRTIQARLLDGPPHAHAWMKRVLKCAGIIPHEHARDGCDLWVAFSEEQAADVIAPVVLVLEAPPEVFLNWPVLMVGGDMVAAAERILDLINC